MITYSWKTQRLRQAVNEGRRAQREPDWLSDAQLLKTLVRKSDRMDMSDDDVVTEILRTI